MTTTLQKVNNVTIASMTVECDHTPWYNSVNVEPFQSAASFP